MNGGNQSINAATVSIDNINILNATVTITSTLNIENGSTLNMEGGLLTGTGSINLNSGSTFIWAGGTIGGNGVLNINAGATCDMNGGNAYLTDTRTINNYGIWHWTGGPFYFTGAPSANNYGIFNIATNADISDFFGSTGLFNNKPSGIINKSGSSGIETSFDNIVFNNEGRINVNSGIMTFNTNSVLSGSMVATFGGQINFSAGTAVFNAGASVSGLGSLNFLGGTDSINTASVFISNISVLNATVIIAPAITFGNGSALHLHEGTLGGRDFKFQFGQYIQLVRRSQCRYRNNKYKCRCHFCYF